MLGIRFGPQVTLSTRSRSREWILDIFAEFFWEGQWEREEERTFAEQLLLLLQASGKGLGAG